LTFDWLKLIVPTEVWSRPNSLVTQSLFPLAKQLTFLAVA